MSASVTAFGIVLIVLGIVFSVTNFFGMGSKVPFNSGLIPIGGAGGLNITLIQTAMIAVGVILAIVGSRKK